MTVLKGFVILYFLKSPLDVSLFLIIADIDSWGFRSPASGILIFIGKKPDGCFDKEL